MDNKQGFLLATLALALITTCEAEEKEKSARWNRCRSAHEAILRVCDIYVPNGLNTLNLAELWNVVDGPLSDAIKANSDRITAITTST